MSDQNRIDDLEILVAHQGRTIEELSEEILRQSHVIDRLQKGYAALAERFQALEDAGTPRPENTPPPHY